MRKKTYERITFVLALLAYTASNTACFAVTAYFWPNIFGPRLPAEVFVGIAFLSSAASVVLYTITAPAAKQFARAEASCIERLPTPPSATMRPAA